MSTGARDIRVVLEEETGESFPKRWAAARQRSIAQTEQWAGILFILVNATLFVRPAEIIPTLDAWPIYAVLATCAVLLALPQLLSQFTAASLAQRPITLCVMGLLAAVVLSHFSKGNLWDARISGLGFLKLVIYYLLLLATVNNLARLKRFLLVLVVLGMVVTSLAVLEYHNVINIPALSAIKEGQTDPATGEHSIMFRLVGTGIFNDPNDLCLLLVLTLAAGVYVMEDKQWGAWRVLWLGPVSLFGYAITLTQSRGGFLALMSAILAFICTRSGWRKGLPVATIALAAMFLFFPNRQTELSVGGGTGQDRVQIWSQGLSLFRHSPMWGVGQGKFADEVGHAAHNSFLHGFAELGFFGGTIFLCAFAMAFKSVYRLRPRMVEELDPDIARLRPYLMAMIVGYAAGLMSLSRMYVVPTYLVLGLAVVFTEIARQGGVMVVAVPRTRTVVAMRMGAFGVMFLGGMYLFVRLFVHWD